MKSWQLVLFGVFGGLIGAAVILIVTSTPRAEGLVIVPPPTPGPAIIHVIGAVTHPGVYEINPEARVQDAITLAGGLQTNAAVEQVNLAAKIHDGAQIMVPTSCPNGNNCPTHPATNSTNQKNNSSPRQININTADAESIGSLPGIGPSKAEAIVTYRENHGPFYNLDDLEDVPGIGEGILEQIKDWVVFE